MRRLIHDLRQYVAAGSVLADVPDGETALPVEHRLATMSQIFLLLQDTIDAQLRPALIRGPLDLKTLVDDCLGVLGAAHRTTVIRCGGAGVEVGGDSVQLGRAVCNVLDNAFRAAGEAGTVSVGVGVAQAMAFVEVSDDGAGFGRVPRGEGHGMAVVAAVVQKHNGRLEISSGPGPGTTVRISIPTWQQSDVAS